MVSGVRQGAEEMNAHVFSLVSLALGVVETVEPGLPGSDLGGLQCHRFAGLVFTNTELAVLARKVSKVTRLACKKSVFSGRGPGVSADYAVSVNTRGNQWVYSRG